VSSDGREVAVDRGSECGVTILESQLACIGCPADALFFATRTHVRGREGEQVSGGFCVPWVRQLLQLRNRVVEPAQGDEHSARVESGQSERRPVCGRGAVFVEGGIELAISLE